MKLPKYVMILLIICMTISMLVAATSFYQHRAAIEQGHAALTRMMTYIEQLQAERDAYKEEAEALRKLEDKTADEYLELEEPTK